MYDSFEPFKRLNIQTFSFNPNRFEIWQSGKMIDSGKTNQPIKATEFQSESGSGALITIRDPSLFQRISPQNDFDIFITGNDRLQLVKVPGSGNGDENMGILMFKMTIGATRNHTDFRPNEPYCCNLFLKEGILSKMTFSFSSPEKLMEFYSDEQKSDKLELEFIFQSSDHIRFENGRQVSGPHGGAPRVIKVEPNVSGGEGYTVTLFNTDGGQARVQMAPKQMKLKRADDQKIELVGFGSDPMGASFADYALTINHEGATITSCILHLLDRSVDIKYLP